MSTRAKRPGFSLIELIIAMLASTVLIASLAATVVISTQLLEVPPDDKSAWHDRFIADRVASDLRYATSVDETNTYGFQITKPNAAGGSPQTVTYESYLEGMNRQISGGPTMHLDPEAPSDQHSVDGYTAPTYLPSGKYARVRSSSTATTSSAVASVDIDVPPGCKPDDLVMLCVSAQTPVSLNVSGSGWQPLSDISAADLRMIAVHRTFNNAWPDSIRVTAVPDSAMAVAMIAIQDVYTSSPIDWSGTASGFSFSLLPNTHPTPLESSGFRKHQLNVQMFAADLDPFTDGALGMAGFTDVVQATAAEADLSLRSTVAIAVRNGATPSLATTPRLFYQSTGFWLQTAARVEAMP